MVLLALSPLAYLAGVVLIKKYDPNTDVGFEVGRREALRAAADYAASAGVNVANWTSGIQVDVSNDRYFYYRLQQGPDVELARRVAPETNIRAMFISPDGKERMQISLGKDGRSLGFKRTLPANREISDPGETAARSLAESAFRSLAQGGYAAPPGAPELSEERKFNRVTRSYSWKQKFPALPELELQTSISVLGDTITTQDITTKFDEAYADKNFLNRQIAPKLTLVPFFLFTAFMAVYGLYRYIQRARQKEVPHARSLLVCGLMSLAFMLMALQTDFLVFNGSPGNEQVVIMLIILLITFSLFLLLGTLLGVAYGSGEGDVREDYPGKLTSLDALLTGRFFSRNVARAICFGIALGGWSLLARSLAIVPWAWRPDGGQGLSDRTCSILLGNFNWATPLLMPFFAVVTAVLGLLLPLSFLHRRFRSRRVSLGLLVLMSLVANLLVFQEQPVTFGVGLLSAIIAAGFLLISFFAFDLLTSIISISAPALSVFIIYLLSQPAASLNRAGFIAGGIALMFLCVGIFFWYFGREYREDQVRPLYARNLAERLGLQAEVSAAREAQARLMPQKLPELSGLNLAAACLPARVVGGDFYDLFVVDVNKLGIFVAEGGGRGLGAALTIAYAKGFLMPRIYAGYSPSELICSLQTQLAPLLEQDEEMAFAYAVVDTSQKTLVYARTGYYPLVLTGRHEHGSRDHGRICAYAEERELNVSGGPSSDTNRVIREATISLAEGDVVIFITDGVVRSLDADHKVSMQDWALGVISKRTDKSNGSLQQSLDRALENRARHIKKIGFEDDLTAVVVRVEPSGAA